MSIVLTESPEASSSEGLRLEYAPPQLEQSSTSYSRALAKHLAETGAKMYGAFWCSHCIEQKEIFGAGAEIPYVECFPDGWERGTPLSGSCQAAKVDGFPTWVINGKKLEGEQTLEKLARTQRFRGTEQCGGDDGGTFLIINYYSSVKLDNLTRWYLRQALKFALIKI